jgi:formate dehydrogenase major subunit
MANADCIVIQGSNMAECHPVGFRWVMEAKRRGATLIHVDPHFSRTSAVADLHVPIRAGSDIAFLGGLIRYVIENDAWFRDYVVSYTNAPAIIDEHYVDAEDLGGIFSGYDDERRRYDITSWQYEGVEGVVPAAGHKEIWAEPGAGGECHGRNVTYEHRDPTLQHPRCVFQILKRHFARYTPEKVAEVCGVPESLFLQVAKALCENSNRERTSAFIYSVGWTQHSVGVQYIRTASILQLLLGNIGRPGGGILALRGHASIQGSTDIPTLYNLLPGYLPMPHAGHEDDLSAYIRTNEAPTGWWSEMPKYMISLLKAWFGPEARKDNDYRFAWLPKLTGDHSHMSTVSDMADGKIRGYFVMGENPAIGSANGALQRKGLRNLEWLVVRDLVLTETADFWRTAPEVRNGTVRPEDIQTEVFFFPAAAHTEKEGSFTNTQRLLQWRHQAVPPPGDARSDLWFVFHLGRMLKAMYEGSTEDRDDPIRHLLWDYPVKGAIEEPDAEAVLKEISGYRVSDREPVPGYAELAADGSTACGCWLYSGCYRDGVNQTARRKPASEQNWVAPDWGWAWPANRRLMYNRASADPQGRPWSERKAYIWWDAEKKIWTGHDVPDFIEDRPPDYRAPKGTEGLASINGDDPFIMQPDGKGWIFAPSGMLDGPLPAHYEPEESPVKNALYPQQCNPTRLEWRRPENPYHRAFEDPRYPHVLVTYRIAEHHTAGGMSRVLTWLSELAPEMFCEVSPELAALAGLENGGHATVQTARGEIACRVLVTPRIRPLRLDGKTVHQIGLPWHWGADGRVRGDDTNELVPMVADPNVQIPEFKVLTGNIVPGRRDHGRRAATSGPPPLDVERLGPAPRDLPGVGQKTSAPPRYRG